MLVEKSKCTGCGGCFNACPRKCIYMERDAEGFLYPRVDEKKCIKCGLCNDSCPIGKVLESNTKTKAYAVLNVDEVVRFNSSSGGFFSVIASYVLDKGGIVYGAVYDYTFKVKHTCVEKEEDLYHLRGAKYSQSEMGCIFNKVKMRLESGQKVLFSGTPCQVAGLKQYLKKDYENLVCVDLICHGVSSPKVWKEYIDYRAKGRKIKRINLRSKESGWTSYSYSTEFEYENHEKEYISNSQDLFMKIFINNLCLRPSCYECIYKSITRISDFTLGDYWGIWKQYPEMDDNKGTSLLFVHSDKGYKIFEELKKENKIISKEVDKRECITDNPSMIKSSEKHKNRDKFVKQVGNKPFDKLVNKYIEEDKYNSIKRLLRKLDL